MATGWPRVLHTTAFVVAVVFGSSVLGHGRDVALLWEPSLRPDVAGYRIYYGPTSRNYTTQIDVGNVTSHTIRDLPAGTWYFSATAISQSGRESGYSNEVFAGPLTLVYPRLTSSNLPTSGLPEYTGIALANLQEAATTLRIVALDQNGSEPAGAGITNPVLVELDPFEQVPFIDVELFGSELLARNPIGWAKIESTSTGVSGFFLMLDAALQVLDGGAIDQVPVRDAILTQIEGEGFTKLSLINQTPDPVAARIDLIDSDGTRVASASRTVAPKGSQVADVASELFPGSPVTASSYLRITSSSELIASQLTGKTGGYIRYLPAQDAAGGSAVLYSPQYAVGGQWRTDLDIVNLAAAPGTVSFRLVGNDGVELGTRAVTIAANGKLSIREQDFFGTPSSPGQLVQGYVEISGPGLRLIGSVGFGDSAQSSFATAMTLVSGLKNSLVFSQVASDTLWYTGMTLVNPNSQATVVTVDVFGGDGSQLASRTFEIQAKGRTSGLLTELLPVMAGQNRSSGYIRVSGNRGLAAFALFGTNNGSVLSAIPAQPVP